MNCSSNQDPQHPSTELGVGAVAEVESGSSFSAAFGAALPLKKTGRQTTPSLKGADALSTATRRAAAIELVQEKAALGEQGFEMVESEQNITYSRVGLDGGSLRRREGPRGGAPYRLDRPRSSGRRRSFRRLG